MSERTDAVVEGLGYLVEEVESGLGRRPTAAELLSLLTHALRSLRDRLADIDMARLKSLNASYRAGVRPSAIDETAELNDAPWEEAVSLVHRLADAFVEPPRLDEFLDDLLTGVHGGDQLLDDIATTDIAELRVELEPPPKGRRPKPGDIVAIADTEYRAVVISTTIRFGTAYGVLGPDGEAVLRHPLLSDDKQVRLGHRPIVGHDSALIERFAEPEQFHKPSSPAGHDLGEHGLAEEAHEAGLDRVAFRQWQLSESLAEWLVKRLA